MKAIKQNTAAVQAVTSFEVGKTYKHNFISNSDCWVFYLVTKRTAKTITVQQMVNGKAWGDVKSLRICKNYCGETGEQVKPEGSYSMAPRLKAEKEVK